MKRTVNKNKKRHFVLTTLASSILCLTHTAYALQELQDTDLRQVNGQDGVSLQTTYDEIKVDQLYWEDRAGMASNAEQTLRAVANDVRVRKNLAYDAGAGAGNYNLGTDYKINTGSSGSKTGLDLQIKSMPSTISVGSFQICAQTPTVSCNASIGNFAIQTGSPQIIAFNTKDGLFSANSQSLLQLGLQNINLYAGLGTGTTNEYNQLILKNFNFNFLGKGAMYVDPVKGLILQTNLGSTSATKATSPDSTYGYVDFTRVTDPNQLGAATGTYAGTSSGLNIELMTKSNTTINPSNPVYNLDNSKGLIRLGMSGRIVNGALQVRGTSANGLAAPADNNATNTHTLNNVLGFASDSGTTATGANGTVMGSSGLALRLRGEFTQKGDAMLGGDDSKATTLEIGGAGSNTFGFEFGDLSPLVINSNQRAYFDSGNVYINLANTRNLRMPENSVLRNARLGGNGGTLTSATDYIQQIHNNAVNPYSLVVAVRGADFQALSRRGRFTSSSGVSAGNAIASNAGLTNKWGLGLPFYNVNANLATYATNYTGEVFGLNNLNNTITRSAVTNSQRLGLAVALSTEGRNADGSKTTSILIVDGDKNYYMGLRNIDMLLRGYGSMGFEGGNVNVELKDLLMVMAAEIAAGYLPTYSNPNSATPVIVNPFNTKDDVLFGLKLKFLGDMNLSLVPNNEITANNGNRLSFIGRYRLKDGSLQISDPIDEASIGFDNMTGLVQFNNAIVVNKDNVGFNLGFNFNPDRTPNDVFRVQDINFYPRVDAANNKAQRLGEMVMTGGQLRTEFAIRPRN